MKPSMLTTQNNFESADDFYEALLNAHQGLTSEQSHAMNHALNARLVLLLADRVGSNQVLNEVLHLAKTSSTKEDLL